MRQRYAHSWVEVYFPGEDEWVAYDPTPAASEIATAGGVGFTAAISKYLEALDTLWIQYFVAFDDQEQRSLARSFEVISPMCERRLRLRFLYFRRDSPTGGLSGVAEVQNHNGFPGRRNASVNARAGILIGIGIPPHSRVSICVPVEFLIS
ncbi:MAG: transglutaminase domain-containing protein [Pyrinomonadaceae bacterium]